MEKKEALFGFVSSELEPLDRRPWGTFNSGKSNGGQRCEQSEPEWARVDYHKRLVHVREITVFEVGLEEKKTTLEN